MATFVSLITLTQHGEEDIRHTIDRSDAFRQMASHVGVQVKDMYWTLGGYDGVVIFEADDDETATALILALGSKGSVRTMTLRAFNREQIGSILDRLP
jgi:uncharacterized protein with GYD domain